MVYGLVGKSGSGKSTAAGVFAEYGFFVIDCDKVAADVLETDDAVKTQLAIAFGEDVIKEGAVDKRKLSERAFSTIDNLQLLNSITHPPILERIKLLSQGKEKVLLDAPTLFESGADKLCDRIIAVISPDELCEDRLLLRDGTDKQKAQRRLSMQKDEAFLRENADAVIENTGNERDFVKLTKELIMHL